MKNDIKDDIWPFQNKNGLKKSDVIVASEMVIASKYNISDLLELSKNELRSLVESNMLHVRSRATKNEMIALLSKL